ncbi:hypothetical protein NP274_00091 [Pseudomonas phage Kara-mokiny kep-wari Wadjak 14]|nr:hypothetical protein NP274_00091 [Pseudomonas phage Kara-mokiny kep-wari Wadjak 14]
MLLGERNQIGDHQKVAVEVFQLNLLDLFLESILILLGPFLDVAATEAVGLPLASQSDDITIQVDHRRLRQFHIRQLLNYRTSIGDGGIELFASHDMAQTAPQLLFSGDVAKADRLPHLPGRREISMVDGRHVVVRGNHHRLSECSGRLHSAVRGDHRRGIDVNVVDSGQIQMGIGLASEFDDAVSFLEFLRSQSLILDRLGSQAVELLCVLGEHPGFELQLFLAIVGAFDRDFHAESARQFCLGSGLFPTDVAPCSIIDDGDEWGFDLFGALDDLRESTICGAVGVTRANAELRERHHAASIA